MIDAGAVAQRRHRRPGGREDGDRAAGADDGTEGTRADDGTEEQAGADDGHAKARPYNHRGMMEGVLICTN